MDDFKLTKLPPATREEQINRWGLKGNGATYDAGADAPVTHDLAGHGLLAAPLEDPTNDGHGEGGWRVTDDDTAEAIAAEHEGGVYGFMVEGGWTVVHVKHGAARTGIHGHRGAVHPDEYVERGELARRAEARLGITVDVLRDVYGGRRGGPLPSQLRPIRDDVDRRLADVENVAALADALGTPELTEALRRGRKRGMNAVRRARDA